MAVRGLRLDEGITAFDLKPSLGILAKDIDTLGLSLQDFHEPLERAVKHVMMPSITKNFDAEGRPAWQPLAAETVKLRAASGYSSGPILQRSGALKAAATSFEIWHITDKAASVQDLPDAVWYGKVHQAGSQSNAPLAGERSILDIIASAKAHKGERYGVTIPQREFIMFQGDDMDAIEETFGLWLEEKVAEHWGRK
jgi:phage gpG-like protein